MTSTPRNAFVLPAAVRAAAMGRSPLMKWPVVIGSLLAAQAATGWFIYWCKQSKRSRRQVGAGVAGAVLLWLVGAGFAVNKWFFIVPDFASLQRRIRSDFGLPVAYQTAGRGQVEKRVISASPTLAMPRSSVWVYTPPGYNPTRSTQYPVAYLIHGHPGTSADWFTLGRAERVVEALIATKMIPPVIVIALDTNGGCIRDGESLNSLNGGPQVESWLYQELVPWVDKNLLTYPDSAHRILAGMSAGGYGALDQGLRHPDVWGGIISLEGYGDPGKVAAQRMGYEQSEFESVSPSHYIPTMEFTSDTPIFLSAAELAGPMRVQLLADALHKRHQPVLFRVEKGWRHTWGYARFTLPYGLAHVVRVLKWK